MRSSTNSSLPNDQVNVYECEVHLKFRIIEDKLAMSDQEGLIENLVDAYAYGNDEYLESLESRVKIQKIQEMEASPAMRRQLIRLRNSQKLA